MMSLILNIESATDICSINISRDGVIVAEREIKGNSHAEKMTLLINECLEIGQIKMRDLDAVAISNGPGSYTSLRIGASTAKGICYALEIPLIAIDTLQSLAMAAFDKIGDKTAVYCPMIDARRMEVYAALYKYSTDKNTLENIEPMNPKIIDVDSYSEYLKENIKMVFCGNGAPKCKTFFSDSDVIFASIECSARYLSYISYQAFVENRSVNIAYHTPQYLKAPNITVPKKNL